MGYIQQVTSLVLWFITFQIAVSLPAQVLVLEPQLLDNFFNKSLDAPSINISVASSLSKRSLSWPDAVAKGTRLLCRLENPDFLDDQSTVTSIDLLPTSGWVKSDRAVDPSVSVALSPFFYQQGIWNNPGDITGVRWRNGLASRNSQGQLVPATRGRYTNLYNTKDGFIIAFNNFGPAWMVRTQIIKLLPDIRAWSDVTFVEWQAQAQARDHDIKGLKYIIRYNIVNADTSTIINQAVGPTDSIRWPGVTFSMRSENGRAVLGTPNGVGVAYLLATHKAQLGQKTVESVHVWSRPPAYFYAVFKIGPVASSSGPSITT